MITPRLTCPITALDITGILRKDPGDLTELCDSITENLSKGLPALIHPVVVDSSMRLISGSRRRAAHVKLGLTEIDYAFFSVLDEGERIRLEVAANYQQRFKWQEHALAVAKYHHFYQTNAHLKGSEWGIRDTARVMNMTRNPVHRCVLLAEYLSANDKEVWEAETVRDAFNVLTKREEDHHARLLVAQSFVKPAAGAPVATPVTRPAADVNDEDFFDSLDTPQGGFTPAILAPLSVDERPGGAPGTSTAPAAPVIPLSTMLLRSSGPLDLSVMESLGAGCCDAIVTDPPYGVEDHIENINQGEHFAQAADVAKEHVAPETAEMMTRFYPLAARALRDRGFIVMWCDPVFWWQHCVEFEKQGLAVQRWPLVWLKTSACVNFCASYNFTKNIEFAVVARKKASTLVSPQKSCVWTGGNDLETKLIGHPFAKPFGLWEWCIKATCSPNSDILDPFVGKGSSVLPMIRLGHRPKGIECSEKHYDGLCVNVMNAYQSIMPNCKFS